MGLVLLEKRKFGNISIDFYQDQNKEFLFTREQIGQALGYSNPRKALSEIHRRNKERLDRFSAVHKVRATDGKVYDTYVYSWRGLYEITMMSHQPRAVAFRDWVYDVLEEIRKTGEFKLNQDTEMTPMDFIIQQAEMMKQQALFVKKMQEKVEAQEEKLDVAMDRINTLDVLNFEGDPRKMLVNKINKYSRESGLPYSHAWRRFISAFNQAYRTNLELRKTIESKKTGRRLNTAEFLEKYKLLGDAHRVIDKMLHEKVRLIS